MLRLYTARALYYRGADALDITRATAERAPAFPGSAFAPPRWLLNVALEIPGARARAREIAPTSPPPSKRSPQAFTRWYETRSISGHATEAMQRHYSTVGEVEQREALARVVDLAGVRRAMQAANAQGEQTGQSSQSGQSGQSAQSEPEGVKRGCESPAGKKKAPVAGRAKGP